MATSFHQLAQDSLKIMGIASTIGSDAQSVDYTMKDQSIITLSDLGVGGSAALSTLICFLPGRDQAFDLMQFALEANLALLASDGAAFTLDGATGKLILTKTFPLAAVDAETLVGLMVRFFGLAQASRRAIVDRDTSRSVAAATSTADGMMRV